MANGKNITLTIPKALINRQAGVAIFPLDKYEALLDDIAMLQSKRLASDIAAARAEVGRGEFVTLAEVKARLEK